MGVTAYTLAAGGHFMVTLLSSYDLKAGGNVVRYDDLVSGVIANGSITALTGVHVKLVVLWVPITSVQVKGDEVEFMSGPVK